MNSEIAVNSRSDLKDSVSSWIKYVFKNSIFIFFSFINLFIPFYVTIMSTLNHPDAIFNLFVTGLSISFITVFNQFLFFISLSIIFVLKKGNLVSKNNFGTAHLILLFASLISISLFILTAMLYVEFSAFYQNLHKTVEFSRDFIAITAFSLLFNSFVYLEILEKYASGQKKQAWILMIAFFVINLLLIPLIGVLPKWANNNYSFGIGLGILVSSILTWVIILIFNRKKSKTIFDIDWSAFKSFVLRIRNFSINFLLATLLKTLLIIGVALSSSLNSKSSPIPLMVSKIIWYNNLFFCGFFVDGLLYAMEYSRLEYASRQMNINYKNDFKVWNTLILIGVIGTLIVCVIFDFIASPLADLYTKNQDIKLIENPTSGITNAFYHGAFAPEVKDYLWSPQGMPNFRLMQTSNKYSKCFSIMYLSIYQIFIATVKLMSISQFKAETKFNWKKLINNFVLIAFIMVFIVVFSSVPQSEGFIRAFAGIDAFSFGMMLVAIILFLLTAPGFFINQKKFTAKNK